MPYPVRRVSNPDTIPNRQIPRPLKPFFVEPARAAETLPCPTCGNGHTWSADFICPDNQLLTELPVDVLEYAPFVHSGDTAPKPLISLRNGYFGVAVNEPSALPNGWQIELWDHGHVRVEPEFMPILSLEVVPRTPFATLDWTSNLVTLGYDLRLPDGGPNGDGALCLGSDRKYVWLVATATAGQRLRSKLPNDVANVAEARLEIRRDLRECGTHTLPWSDIATNAEQHLWLVMPGRAAIQLSDVSIARLGNSLGQGVGSHLQTFYNRVESDIALGEFVGGDGHANLEIVPTELTPRGHISHVNNGFEWRVGVVLGRRAKLKFPSGFGSGAIRFGVERGDESGFAVRRSSGNVVEVLVKEVRTETAESRVMLAVHRAGEHTVRLVFSVKVMPLLTRIQMPGQVVPVPFVGVDIGTSTSLISTMRQGLEQNCSRLETDNDSKARLLVAAPTDGEFGFGDHPQGTTVARSIKTAALRGSPMVFGVEPRMVLARFVMALLARAEVRVGSRLLGVRLSYPPIWPENALNEVIAAMTSVGREVGVEIVNMRSNVAIGGGGSCANCPKGASGTNSDGSCTIDEFTRSLTQDRCVLDQPNFVLHMTSRLHVHYEATEPESAARFWVANELSRVTQQDRGIISQDVQWETKVVVVDMGAGTTDLALITVLEDDQGPPVCRVEAYPPPESVVLCEENQRFTIAGDTLDIELLRLLRTSCGNIDQVQYWSVGMSARMAFDANGWTWNLTEDLPADGTDAGKLTDALEACRRMKEACLTHGECIDLWNSSIATVPSAQIGMSAVLGVFAPYFALIAQRAEAFAKAARAAFKDGCSAMRVLYVGNSYVASLHRILTLIEQGDPIYLNAAPQSTLLAQMRSAGGPAGDVLIRRHAVEFANICPDFVALVQSGGAGVAAVREPKAAVAKGLMVPLLFTTTVLTPWIVVIAQVQLAGAFAPDTWQRVSQIDCQYVLAKKMRNDRCHVAIYRAGQQFEAYFSAQSMRALLVDNSWLAVQHIGNATVLKWAADGAGANAQVLWSWE